MAQAAACANSMRLVVTLLVRITRLSPAHLPLCCYPELTVHRHACSSAHHDAVQQGDVRHVHRPQLVIQGILGSEEAAEHHTEVDARGFSTSFRQRLTCRDADGKNATV